MTITEEQAATTEALAVEEPPLAAEPLAAEPIAAEPLAVTLPPEFGGRDRSVPRLAVAAALSTVAAAVMVGGIFRGASPRVYAIFGSLLGVGLGVLARRLRRPAAVNLTVVVGLFLIGFITIAPTGLGNVVSATTLASNAARVGGVLRPPVPFLPGWAAIEGWLMGILGLVSVWLAVTLRIPALGLVVPLPVAAIAGISVPKNQQVGSGLAVLGLFAVALGVLSSAQQVGDEDTRVPLSYEMRRAGRAAALLVTVLVGLWALAQSNVLFPKPVIDPTRKPQKPHVTPLSEVPDRVLFTVETKEPQLPFRTGSLDVYDGHDWLLAPFAESRLRDVPRDGVVDHDLVAGAEARFAIAGLTGAVLPALPDPVGVVAEGPKLAYDSRNATIRVSQGQVEAGLKYAVTAEALPTSEDLARIVSPNPPELDPFTRIPSPPPAVTDLLARAPHTGRWDTWNFARLYILDNVVVSGLGTPKSMPVSRAQEILASPKAGASPFEVVALEAMLARWAGIPARIGYGFAVNRHDPEIVGGKYQLRPKDGIAFPEVWFPGFKWLPVIGDPRQARPTQASTNLQQQNPNVVPSNDIAVQVFLPLIVPPPSTFTRQLRNDALAVVIVLAVLGLLYVLYPAARKAQLRARCRAAALLAGPRARAALAYAEWRDLCTDFGYRHDTDTPLMFLERFAPDDEHAELAWLVTRVLWGDLQDSITDGHALAAEELSRALRQRLAAAQPATLRAVAVVSRLSLRHPYAPETDLSVSRAERQGQARKEPARVPAGV